MADPECSGFEPQNYLRDRCKKCFRLREKHEGMTNFMRTPGDHHKDTEIVIRSQLRSPIVTVRRAQSNPAKMLTTATAPTTRLISVPLAEEGAAKPIVCGGRRTWKLSSHDTTKSQAVNKNVVEKDDEIARFSIASKKQHSAQARPSSATTTVLLSKQHQISLGHSNSLHEQRKSLKSSVACCSLSAENGLTQNDQTGAKGDNEEARISSSARRTALKEQQQKQENSGRKRFSERNGSWQFMGDKFVSTAGQQQNGVEKHHELNSDDETEEEEEEEEEEELLSLSSYKSANSIMERSATTNATTTVDEMFSARSVESLTNLSCADSFKTGKSPPFDDPMEDPFMTPKSMSEAQHFFGSDDEFERAMTPTAMEFKQQEFFHLRGENRRLMEQCRRYRHERKRWTEWLRKRYGNWKEKERDNGGKREQQQTTTVAVDGKRLMEDALTEMETMLNEYRDENSELKGKLMEKRDGLIHDRDMMSASASTVISNGTCTGPTGAVVLEERLQMSESMCEQLRRDRKELEREIEEMQDQYRVEEIEEFRELQRELEQSAKNGRILQFKLRKAERQRDQLQAEKNLLARVQRGVGGAGVGGQRDGNDSMAEEEEQMGRRVTELEQELRVSKEVSLKLHNELEVAEEKRYKLEDELFYQKEKVRELLAQNRWREARQAKGRSVEEALLEASRSAENLPKEVRDTLEREADLREQLRFTEADLQRTRQRLHELERENDELLQRYSNLAERHSEVQSKATAAAVPPTILLTPPKQKPILRSISDGAEEASSASQKQHCNKSDGRKTDEMHGRSASAAETNRTPVDKEKAILMEKSEESHKKLSTMAEEVNELRRKCAECEREIGELRESAVSYKQMNGELRERMARLRDEWEDSEKRREANSAEKVQKALKELKDARKQLDIECLKRESAERSLAENRAVLEKLNATIIETNAELNRSRQRVGELDREQDKLKKWEGRCKEMKLERVRIQANAMELKKRTDEAVQELGKMSRAHQQKEIGWMREKKQLEEQLQELTKTTASKTIAESGSQSSTTSSGSQQQTMDRIEELEQEKKCLEAKMEELKKIREQELAAYQTQKQQWQKEREQIVAKNKKMGGADSHTNAPLTNDRPDVDYKQIADNALRAAETLQKQYREYQKHYTAEVQRLSGNLVKLEQELAMRQHQQQQITTIMRTDTGADQKPDENNNDNDAINVSAVIKMPAQHQAQHLTRTRRAHSSAPKVPMAVPMLQCRPVEIHPSSPLAGLGQGGIAVMDDGDFGSVDDVQQKYRRTGSAGTNILYRIRREELAQGKHPTVRQMARAFESFEKLQQKGNNSEEPKRKRIRQTKGGLFGLLGKSSSMEVSSMSEKNLKTPKAFRKGERTTSETVPLATERIGIRGGGGSPSPMPSSTLPRGGRNPFKGFSSRIVERVRRSLSRSKKSQSRDGGPSRDGTPSLNITAITADGLKWN
uniref:Myosin_tail_1 domain-containing protein n=1 Tax=Globodera pallida TaxID=36090 RepID=A0A183BS71_GLOPA